MPLGNSLRRRKAFEPDRRNESLAIPYPFRIEMACLGGADVYWEANPARPPPTVRVGPGLAAEWSAARIRALLAPLRRDSRRSTMDRARPTLHRGELEARGAWGRLLGPALAGIGASYILARGVGNALPQVISFFGPGSGCPAALRKGWFDDTRSATTRSELGSVKEAWM
ncbi:MAG: hypothetical protein CL908_10335 [Deltaproteobacteria bacterium]|nr:hypothetical protein [Deltaproteobacteria bacterium]